MEEERVTDQILATFATRLCRLQELREEDFNKKGEIDYNYIVLSARCF